MRSTRLVLLVIVGLGVAPGPLAGQQPATDDLRRMVENAALFLEDIGEPEDIVAARRIRELMAAGNIRLGTPQDEADRESMAWTEYGVVSVNSVQVGRASPATRGGWTRIFDLAMTLTHEVVHVDQGQDYVNETGSFFNRTILGKPFLAEVEGWRVGGSNATRWLEKFADRLASMPPEERARMADWLHEQTSSIESSLTPLRESGYLSDPDAFHELEWRRPGGGTFATEAEIKQYLAGYRRRMEEVMWTANRARPGTNGRPDPTAGGDRPAAPGGAGGWAVYLITNYGGPGTLAPGGYVAVGGPGYEQNPPLLSSLAGGGRDPSRRATPQRVSGGFPSKEEAVRSMCAQVTNFFRHPLARFIQMAQYQGQNVGVDPVFQQLCTAPAGQ